jgi:hypothetical protein
LADIDENVQTLLSVLDDTPAGALADTVRERIRAIDEPVEATTIYPRERARNQMKLANEIVTGFIERELNMTKRLKAIAEELEIKAVPVVTGEGTPTDDLIDGQRRQTLETFQDAWGALVRNILDGMAGRDGFQG